MVEQHALKNKAYLHGRYQGPHSSDQEPTHLQKDAFDIKGTAYKVEQLAKNVLHTPESGNASEAVRAKLRESLTSLTREQQQQVAEQINTDNNNLVNTLPKIDVDYTRDGHILGLVMHASKLDFGADHKADGINITPAPIEELPGYGTGPLD